MMQTAYSLFFKVLSNITRLKILELLRQGPRNATEIGEALGFEQSRVSHNMTCLVNCGFVTVKTRGKNKVYSLNEETIVPLLGIIEKHVQKYGRDMEGCEVLKDMRKVAGGSRRHGS